MRTIDNSKDTARTYPTKALAPRVLNAADGAIEETITGPAGGATVKLSKPATKVIAVQSFVTATGAFSAKPNLVSPTDFTINLSDPNNGNVCTLKEALGTNYSAATWVVTYLEAAAEGTIGGQSSLHK